MRISVKTEINQRRTRAQIKSLIKEFEGMDYAFDESVGRLFNNIVKSAPYDTGRYKNGWLVPKHLGNGNWIIKNVVYYNKFLIFGTRYMPIQHDVRGIINEWKKRIPDDVQVSVDKAIDSSV